MDLKCVTLTLNAWDLASLQVAKELMCQNGEESWVVASKVV